MKNLSLQQICVFQNDKHKFVHIGVYNMLDNKGVPNYKAKLSSMLQDSIHMKKIAFSPYHKSIDNSFGSSFKVRLMNTDALGWETTRKVENLDLYEAQSVAAEISSEYETLGYSVTGSIGNKAVRHTGVKGVTNIVIKNATMNRLYQIAEKLVSGVSDINVPKVQQAVYKQYVYHGLDTRRKLWGYIHYNIEAFTN